MRKIETYNDKKKAFCCPHCGSEIDYHNEYSSLWDIPYDITNEARDTCEKCGNTFYWLIGIAKEEK